MLRSILLALILALAAFSCLADTQPTSPAPVQVYMTDDDYEDVKENLAIAITDRGMLISGTLHISDMLKRTAMDLGYKKQVYLKAESLEFCSAKVSHEMVLLDSSNLTICPFTVALYVLKEQPERVYVAFRRPSLAGHAGTMEASIFAMLEGIVKDALE